MYVSLHVKTPGCMTSVSVIMKRFASGQRKRLGAPSPYTGSESISHYVLVLSVPTRAVILQRRVEINLFTALLSQFTRRVFGFGEPNRMDFKLSLSVSDQPTKVIPTNTTALQLNLPWYYHKSPMGWNGFLPEGSSAYDKYSNSPLLDYFGHKSFFQMRKAPLASSAGAIRTSLTDHKPLLCPWPTTSFFG